MKKNIFLLLSIILFIITACNNDEAEINIGTQENPVTFTTRADATDGVSVLIFGKEQTADEYTIPFTPQWVNGTAYKTLYLGTYNFLFYKWEEKGNVTTTPSPLAGGKDKKAEDIRFNAIQEKAGYHKPVEMIWLPVKPEKATEEHEITGDKHYKVTDTLQNVVSKVDVIIKRGIRNPSAPGGYDEFGIKEGANRAILDDIESIDIEIDKIGTSVGINGTDGTSKTKVERIGGAKYTPEGGVYNGYAIFEGPLVFPNGKAEISKIDITVTPKANTPYKVMKASVQEKLIKDQKLEIIIWLTATYQLITVYVDPKELTTPENGDTGIWE